MAFDAILLAAGYGTRLRPLTDVLPKCLVPIHGRPLIDYWLEPLFAAGAERVLINTHYKADLVASYIGMSPWQERISIVREDTLLGTAGTLVANAAFLGDRPCLLAQADNLSIFSVSDFLTAHEQRPSTAIVTMMTFTATDPKSCGIVCLDADGIVTEFHEKVDEPPGTLANGAVFVVDSALLDEIAWMPQPVAEISTDVLPHLLGRIATWHNSGYHRDIGTPASLAEARQVPPALNAGSGGTDRWDSFMRTLSPEDRSIVSE